MWSAEVRLSRSSPKHIGSVDPYALKIPAPKGRNTSLQWNVTSPFHAEPGHRDDIRKNRDNVAQQLGFIGRVMHGSNPRSWDRELRRRIAETVDYSLSIP